MHAEENPGAETSLWEVQPGWRLAYLLHVGTPPGYLEMEVSQSLWVAFSALSLSRITFLLGIHGK